MPLYRIEHRAVSSSAPFAREFEARDDEAALEKAAGIIAESHGAPNAHVQIDLASEQVTVGAGYWSRRGSFRLQRLEPPAERDSELK